VAVVLGAGGALGPDVVHGLLRRVSVVAGVDLQLTYVVSGATYRQLDLCDAGTVHEFFSGLRGWANEHGLQLGTCYDLATIQTSPSEQADRGALGAGKQAVLAALGEGKHGARLVYMSTAEVYGAPPGAPYAEDHEKAPINVYGRHKLLEENAVLSADQPGDNGIRTVALRTWTISMVNFDDQGRVRSARNYNDPMIALAKKMASAGLTVPVANPDLRAQFHRSEEVAEVCVRLGEQPHDSDVWGRAWNCIGKATTHGRMRDVCLRMFASHLVIVSPWWAKGVDRLLRSAWLTKTVIGGIAQLIHRVGGWLGATRFGERLPFLYRSTDIDATELRQLLGTQLTEPAGNPSEEAIALLCEGICVGGPQALNFRRYQMY